MISRIMLNRFEPFVARQRECSSWFEIIKRSFQSDARQRKFTEAREFQPGKLAWVPFAILGMGIGYAYFKKEKEKAVDDFVDKYWYGSNEKTKIIGYVASEQDYSKRVFGIAVGGALDEFIPGKGQYSYANMKRLQERCLRFERRKGLATPFEEYKNIKLVDPKGVIPADALWLMNERQMNKFADGNFVFHIERSYIDERFRESEDHYGEEGKLLNLLDVRGEEDIDELVKGVKGEVHVHVTDFRVEGQHVVLEDIARGVERVVFLMGDDRRVEMEGKRYLAALEAVGKGLECVLEYRVNSRDIEDRHPDLFIRTITQSEAGELCKRTATAFVNAQEDRPHEGLLAGGGVFNYPAHAFGSKEASGRAAAQLGKLWAEAGVDVAIFACGHSNSRGPMAALAVRDALRENNIRNVELLIMYPGLGRLGGDIPRNGSNGEVFHYNRGKWEKN